MSKIKECVKVKPHPPPLPSSTRSPYTTLFRSICWRIGEAPTSWPVLRSCRLSFEIVAQAKTIAVMKSAKATRDRKSTRLNSSHRCNSYAVFCLKKKKKNVQNQRVWERQATSYA